MPTKTYTLYPVVTVPERPAWADIEVLALHHPAAQRIVTLVNAKELTQEQGLCMLCLFLYNNVANLHHDFVSRQSHSVPTFRTT